MGQDTKAENRAQIERQNLTSGAAGCPRYKPKSGQEVVAHVQIIRDEKIEAFFKGAKESYGVFFNGEYVGVVQRPKGNQMWNAYPKGTRHSSTKKTAKTPAAAAWALVENAFCAALSVKEKIKE